MLRRITVIISGIVLSGLSPITTSADASDLPREAADLKFEHEVKLAELRKPLVSLARSYLNRLEVISGELQSQGDLPGLLAARAESKSVAATGNPVASPPNKEPSALIQARIIYVREQTALANRISRNADPLIEAYRIQLEKLKIRYTQEQRLEEALAVKTLLESIPMGEKSIAPLKKNNLKIKVQVDGSGFLLMRGSEIWFDHSGGKGAPPGRHHGEFSTYLNDSIEWKPEWDGKISKPFDAGISLATSGPGEEISLLMSSGRGYAKVVEQPSAENDFTAKIQLLDERFGGKGGFGGSDWMVFRVSW